MNEIYINIKDFGDNSWLGKYLFKKFNKDLISVDNLLDLIEDLKCDVEYLEDKVREMEQDIEENYRPIPYAEQVCVSNRDFI